MNETIYRHYYCRSVDSIAAKKLGPKFPVDTEIMTKHCWGSHFIGTPCRLIFQTAEASKFKYGT